MDGSYKAIKCDPNATSVEELWEVVSSKLMLTPASCVNFFVWGVAGDLELLLYTQQSITDVYKDWSVFEQRYNKKAPSLTLTKSKKSFSTIQKSPSQDFVNPGSPEKLVLRFSTTAVLPLDEEKKFNDPGAIHLYYIQAVHNVIMSNYPCDAETAIRLGGIQLQLTVGDRNPDVHKAGYLLKNLASYVPEHLLEGEKKKPEEWELALFKQHEFLRGKDGYALKMGYLNLVREWAHYGCTFFKAKYVQTDTFYKHQFEGKVRLGINCNGFHIIDPKVKIVSFTWDQIMQWDSDKQNFWIEIEGDKPKGLFAKMKKVDNKVYTFKSNQSELINDMLCDWQGQMDKHNELENMHKNEKHRGRRSMKG
jgi:hypothetical protein